MDKNLWSFQPRNNHIILSPPTGLLPLYPRLSPGDKAKYNGWGLYGFSLWCPECESSIWMESELSRVDCILQSAPVCVGGLLACFGLMSTAMTFSVQYGRQNRSWGPRHHPSLKCKKIPLALYSALLHRQIGTLLGLYYAVGLHSRRVIKHRSVLDREISFCSKSVVRSKPAFWLNRGPPDLSYP